MTLGASDTFQLATPCAVFRTAPGTIPSQDSNTQAWLVQVEMVVVACFDVAMMMEAEPFWREGRDQELDPARTSRHGDIDERAGPWTRDFALPTAYRRRPVTTPATVNGKTQAQTY